MARAGANVHMFEGHVCLSGLCLTLLQCLKASTKCLIVVLLCFPLQLAESCLMSRSWTLEVEVRAVACAQFKYASWSKFFEL